MSGRPLIVHTYLSLALTCGGGHCLEERVQSPLCSTLFALLELLCSITNSIFTREHSRSEGIYCQYVVLEKQVYYLALTPGPLSL